jgi:myosin heavy subunit
MNLLFLICALTLIAAIPAAALLVAQRLGGEETDEQMAALREESRDLEQKIIDFLSNESSIASKSQLKSLKEHAKEFADVLTSQRQLRDSLERKLKEAQSQVLERESANRELKTEKEEDDAAFTSVLSNYNDISSESVDLERRLADSLKTLDKLSTELGITEDQRAVLDQLQAALTSASSQLRDVIVAHQNIFERLQSLQSQYQELETEYVKLVELQLEG